MLQKSEVKISNYTRDGKDMIISIIPIQLLLHDFNMDSPSEPGDQTKQHSLTLCMVYKKSTFLKSLTDKTILTFEFFKNLAIMFALLILTLGIAYLIAFRLSHCIFRPLRSLNRKMKDVILDGMKHDLIEGQASSIEVSFLYEVF